MFIVSRKCIPADANKPDKVKLENKFEYLNCCISPSFISILIAILTNVTIFVIIIIIIIATISQVSKFISHISAEDEGPNFEALWKNFCLLLYLRISQW
jgi:predicted PurR-regulated permease PerM